MSLRLKNAAPVVERYTADDIRQLVAEQKKSRYVRGFRELWYAQPFTWAMTKYQGIPILKHPSDLQIYHEIIWAVRPHVIIETGSAFGGSALWFADQMRGWDGRVISIDVNHPRQAVGGYVGDHPSINFLVGDSRSRYIVDSVADRVSRLRERTFADAPRLRIMVVLDSDHERSHVRSELWLYHQFVTPGSFLVVEDTNVDEFGVEGGEGPAPAVREFLENEGKGLFEPELLCERYLNTANPGGWLARIG